MRGQDNAESTLRLLLELRANGIPELQARLCRTKYKCLFRDILNSMLEIVATGVLTLKRISCGRALYHDDERNNGHLGQ